jgi:hypothetical protein
MNVKFNVGNYWLSKATEIHYNIDEYSFSFEPYNNGAALLLINDLNLSANEENMLLGVWGLCPHTQWKPTNSFLDNREKRDLYIDDSRFLDSGVATRINQSTWEVFINETKQWVCIGNPDLHGCSIEFAPGAVLVLSEQSEALSMWLKISG